MAKELDSLYVLATPRVGSTWFCSMLNECQQNFQLKEYYKLLPVGSELPRFSKVFIRQLEPWGLDILQVLERFPAAKIIHLKRKDIIATAVSYYLAITTNVWLLRNTPQLESYKKKIPQEIDYTVLSRVHQKLLADTAAWETILADNHKDFHVVYYEDLLQNPLQELTTVFDYLGVEDSPESCLAAHKHIQFPKTDFYEKCYSFLAVRG